MILYPNSIVQHVIGTKNETMINVNVSIKSILHGKKILVGMVAYVFARIGNFW